MKRRALLKGLSVVAGSALCSTSAWPMFGMDETPAPDTPLAMPIRGLMRKDGRRLQPIQMTIPHSGPDTAVITKLNGTEIDRRARERRIKQVEQDEITVAGWGLITLRAEHSP
jgi:alpha-mannosidase